jgi:hypothetical protein
MDQAIVFDTLTEAIAHAFKLEEATVLSLDRICAILSQPNLHLRTRDEGVVACSMVTRRRISSTLSSCDVFQRAGAPRTCMWGMRSAQPPFLSDTALTAAVEQLLTKHGPLTSDQLMCLSDIGDAALFATFFDERPTAYACAEDGSWWFAGHARPARVEYESMVQALLRAFAEFPNGATVEDLHWVLCLSTIGAAKAITRRRVSRELSRRTDLFAHVSRAKYAPLRGSGAHAVKIGWLDAPPCPDPEWEIPLMLVPNPDAPIPQGPPEEDDFNADAFFPGDFQFAGE